MTGSECHSRRAGEWVCYVIECSNKVVFMPYGYCPTCGAKLNADGTEEPRDIWQRRLEALDDLLCIDRQAFRDWVNFEPGNRLEHLWVLPDLADALLAKKGLDMSGDMC